MDKKPLLIFPQATSEAKTKKSPGRGVIHFPSKENQVSRFENRLSEIQRVLENESAHLQTDTTNIIPEMILVLEVAGTLDNFFRAVEKTSGMEFLMELQGEFEADENFYTLDSDGNRTNKPVDNRIFLTMTNLEALRELQGYWNEYKKAKEDQNFKRGTSRFRYLFEQLKDIRPYNIYDRLRDTGFNEYLNELRRYQVSNVKFEIELAFKSTAEKNSQAFNEVQRLITNNQGQVVSNSRVVMEEINYHAFIAEAPIGCFENLTENTSITFLKSQQILFFRPVGQVVFKHPSEVQETQSLTQQNDLAPIIANGEPIIALLDGLPLENHSLLTNRLAVDDSDNYSRNYTANKRIHGTSMASLILNGDLKKPSPLSSPIYVRPILKPEANSFSDGEFLPDDVLPVDLVHRCVVRMFERDGETLPAAPTVRVINFSIGDSSRPFNTNMSPWARLLDWLSCKYNILFIVSAGNFSDDILINVPHGEFDGLDQIRIQELVLKHVIERNFNRKIITPAESINSLTVGSSHHDYSEIGNLHQRKNLIALPSLLSPVSRIGFGYGKSIKPEVLMPGGRKLYRKAPIQTDPTKTLLTIEALPFSSAPPGNCVALPGGDGRLDSIGFTCGTSNSAALTSNLAGRLHELLLQLNQENDPENRIDESYFTVIIKCLITHGAAWGEAYNILNPLIRNLPGVASSRIRSHITPYLGFGLVDSDRVLYCTEHRVTLIGFGQLSKDPTGNAHIYSFPLPPSIGQQRIEKKVIVSLAWLSPLNFRTSKYRKAQLYFNNLRHNDYLSLNREYYDFDLAQKGTVQHDILVGNQADAFIDGDMLKIKVNCREDASSLSIHENIRYGIAVTLQIQENVGISIYEEVKQRIQQRVRPRV